MILTNKQRAFLSRIVLSYFLIIIAMFVLGCEDIYRYPCHDPENWNKKECIKPDCIANGDCSEMIIGENKFNTLKDSNETLIR